MAAATYARRRAIVTDVLETNGVAVSGTDGINLWMRVADERSATVALAAAGIGVAPGGPFLVRPDDDHLRVTVGLITGSDDHVTDVATRLAAAAAPPPHQTQPPPLRRFRFRHRFGRRPWPISVPEAIRVPVPVPPHTHGGHGRSR